MRFRSDLAVSNLSFLAFAGLMNCLQLQLEGSGTRKPALAVSLTSDPYSASA